MQIENKNNSKLNLLIDNNDITNENITKRLDNYDDISYLNKKTLIQQNYANKRNDKKCKHLTNPKILDNKLNKRLNDILLLIDKFNVNTIK